MGTPNFAPSSPMQNPNLANVMDRMTNGKEMRRLFVERQALLTSLKATGLAQPASIWEAVLGWVGIARWRRYWPLRLRLEVWLPTEPLWGISRIFICATIRTLWTTRQ